MKTILYSFILILAIAVACDFESDSPVTNPPLPDGLGSLEFRFIMPYYQIPEKSLHRVSLSFAYSIDSLYKSEFFKKINVSDYQEVYRLEFPPREYYYDAIITCSCQGDTCLNGGFPGGQYGMKHHFNKFEIITQRTTIIETHFQ